MSLKFSYPIQILEQHLDTFGHVNNATYLTLYEEARWDLIEKNGFGMAHIIEKQVGPVLLEANLKFKRELTNRENIVIETKHLETISDRFMTLQQQMVKEDGSIASELQIKICLIFK